MSKRVKRKRMKRESDGTKALRLVKKIKNNIEMKFFDQNNVLNVSWLSNNVSNIIAVPQGQTDSSRIGDVLAAKSFRLSLCLTSLTVASVFRVILYWDKQNLISTVGDLLHVTGSSMVVNSAYNHDNRSRYIILLDKLWTLQDPATSVALKTFTRWFSLKNKQVKYAAASTTVLTNNLKLFLISDKDPATAINLPEIQYYTRLHYTDC